MRSKLHVAVDEWLVDTEWALEPVPFGEGEQTEPALPRAAANAEERRSMPAERKPIARAIIPA